ncbi:MAG: glucosaminidase domain-containing protein [Mucilaginibacter polytrichastri]|nr:glucosaminidase domain-containing protein [Mucilaginibacter polytrichastri]
MKRSLLLLVPLLILVSCSSRKKTISHRAATKNNRQVYKGYEKGRPEVIDYSTEKYIERFADIAVFEMNQYGIPASITLAQAIHESGTGNSELARVANNHFGIKCTSDWGGRSYYKDDDRRDDCFRVYRDPEESFRDHSEFLKRRRYAQLFELDKNDYKGWAYGLKAAGYATNPRYPQIIISIVERYQLDRYDQPETYVQKVKREDRVLSDINQNPNAAGRPVSKEKPADDSYVVVKGDTLYSIAKRFGFTVDELQAINNLPDTGVQIGQKLIVRR